jgi:heat shock protein HtpX
MAARGRTELFPRDRGLTARMLVAAVLPLLLVLVALVAVVAVAPTEVMIMTGVALLVGTAVVVRDRSAGSTGEAVSAAQLPEAHAIVERLCVAADLPKPAVMLVDEAQPNSWIKGTRRAGYKLHLTRGLLARLEPRELEAVIGHELAHVAHRDAAVMTVVGSPAAALLAGGLRVARGWLPAMIAGLIAAGIGWLASLGTRALSRYREFAADAGAVALTGSPAALASALVKVSDGMVSIPTRDLRAAAARDVFHLLPAARDGNGAFRLPASHPPLRARIERLERMERTLQRAR